MTLTDVPTRSSVGSGQPLRPRRTRLFALREMRWAATALVLFLAGLAVQLPGGPWWAYWPLYTACYAAGGWEPGLAGLRALRAKTLDVDLLMVAAAIGAAAIGQVLDGGLLIVIFATSGALEALATARTQDSVRGLLDLAPDTATRLAPDGIEPAVAVTELVVGDVILVRPGERVGADGAVVDGASEVDQATITGEPLPIDKATGDEVFAGTINGTGALRVRVDRPAGESVVARIALLVEEAARTKARTQLFIEKIERRYSVGMVAATVALFVIPLLAGQPLAASLLRAMTFMIVASPCAVVLSTMPPLLAAIANAGRHGVLVKSAVVMEQLGTTSQIAFDKTGTLTQGRPRVSTIRVAAAGPACSDDLLALAAAAEHPSEHPLAEAVVAAARDAGIQLLPATDFAAVPGRGVTARVAGRTVAVGSPRHLLPDPTSSRLPDATSPDLRTRQTAELVTELEEAGQTAVTVTLDGKPAGVLGLVDQLRDEAGSTVTALTELTGHTPLLLTGDNPRAAAHLALQVGITDIRGGLLPEDKVAAVRDLQAAGQRVTVVGDGINDAPALAAAHAGIAMGGAGSDLTLQTADAVVVRDDLTTIPSTIGLSRRARSVLVANLVIAATVITGLVVWDLLGYLPLPVGVAGHEGSTVIVGLNGLRMLRTAAWPRPAAPVGRTDEVGGSWLGLA